MTLYYKAGFRGECAYRDKTWLSLIRYFYDRETHFLSMVEPKLLATSPAKCPPIPSKYTIKEAHLFIDQEGIFIDLPFEA
jgi:hypothetical protein